MIEKKKELTLVPIKNKPIRHILALSGGKDSSALAIYLLGKIPNIEYVFCDTEKELKETYEYLFKIEAFLGKKINFLKYEDGYGFDEVLQLWNGFLPSPKARWCTEYLKLKPYEDFIGNDPVISYVGIRADEAHRKGYISKEHNVKTVLPFVENGICLEDVEGILEESGLGMPDYYKWRSRSGCYFCFFQQKREWIGLLRNHPDLFEKAKKYEKFDEKTGEHYTWNQAGSLDELAQHADEIMERYEKKKKNAQNNFKGYRKLKDVWNFGDEEPISCNICHL